MDRSKTTEAVNKLLMLFAGGVVLAAGTVAPNIIRLLEPLIDKHSDKDEELLRLLAHMRRLKLISTENLKDGNKYVSLTLSGLERLNQVNMSEVEIPTPKQWDGFWRIVTFDIPKDKKRERYELLNQLHRLGFVKLLQSMWVFPFPCSKEVNDIAAQLELDRYLVYMDSKLTAAQHSRLLSLFKDKLKHTKLVISKQ